jgi:hypothetical protein
MRNSMADGDVAYVKWQVRAVFVPGPEGKPVLLDNGFREISGGTGKFNKMSGAGILHIKPVSQTDRRFIFGRRSRRGAMSQGGGHRNMR